MRDLEETFGVKLNSTYAYSPYSLAGIKAWRPVYVYGFDVTRSEQPQVQYAEGEGQSREYKKVSLCEFKTTFKPVIAEVGTKNVIELSRCG